MSHFTPMAALCGGALIGLAAAILWLANGRIAGISGIVGGLLEPKPSDTSWRLAFIAGLVAAPVLYEFVFATPKVVVTADPAVLVPAGLLVGFGTRLGGGCTSGHGVCGLGRLSYRSIAATALFMIAAAATVFFSRHVSVG